MCGEAIALVWVVVALVADVALRTFLRRAGEIADEREAARSTAATVPHRAPPRPSGFAYGNRVRPLGSSQVPGAT
jgi:hypothetical protein